MPLDVESIRKDFPALSRKVRGKPLIYLDSAATTQKPIVVLHAMQEYYERHNANVHRSIHTLGEEATEAYVRAHEEFARLVQARPEGVVFTKNATEAINLVAYSFGLSNLREGDEIVVTRLEHHANFVPWQQIAQRTRSKLRIAPLDEQGRVDLDRYEELLSSKTRLVALSGMSNVLGTIPPVERMIQSARDVGAVTLVDGAQLVPHRRVDFSRMGADFLVASGHKMLGPTGIGVLVGRTELLESLPPFLLGGDMIRKVEDEDSLWNDLPWKFEAGTPPIAEAVGLEAAISYLKKVGFERIEEHERNLVEKAWELLERIPGLRILGPPPSEDRGGVISFVFDGIHAHDIASLLDDRGIAIRAGHHCAQPLMRSLGIPSAARASFYLYTTKEEIEALADGLESIRRVFR